MSPSREESGRHAAPEGAREGSVSTSLQELLRLEDQRQRREEAEALRHMELERAAREASARRAREAEEAERRRALAEGEAESARRDAMRASVIEEARTFAEAKVRAAEDERRRLHELEIARLRGGNAQRHTGSGIGIGVLLGAALGVTVAAAGYAGILRPQILQANDAALRAIEARRVLRDQMDEALAGERAKASALRSELDAARTAVTRLERDLEAAHPAEQPAFASPRSHHGPLPKVISRAAESPCRQGDPLCTNLETTHD